MEIFFQESNSIDVIVVEELLLRKYNNIDYILTMEVENGVAFIKKAFEKEDEDKMWARYLVDYRNMTEDNFMTFNQYKKMLTTPPPPMKPLYMAKRETEIRVEQIINLTLVKGGE